MNRSRKQSSTNYPMNFFMALADDHITGAEGLTPTVTISKNGGAFAAPDGAVTEIGNGWYSLAGDADDRSTLGEFLLHAEAETADPADEKYTIESHDPFNLAEPGAEMDLIDAPNATAVTAIQSGLATAVWNYLTTALTVTGSVGKLLTDNIDAPISEAGGGSGLDAAGVRAAVGLSTANLDTQLSTINSNVDAILVDTSTTIPALINADSGAGAISWTYTLTDSDDGTPIDGAEVWVTTDAAGEDVVASGSTNSFGVVTFMLDAGAYYFWRKCSGYNFNNPDLETVS